MTTELDLAAIEARANATTEGPWAIWADVSPNGYVTVGDEQGVLSDSRPFTEECNEIALVDTDHDAEFIAHARTDVPALLAALRATQAEVAAKDAVIERVKALIEAQVDYVMVHALRKALTPTEAKP